MSTEYGVFNDEGCIERGAWSKAKADELVAAYRAEGDEWAYAAEMCTEHDEQPSDTCEECFAEEDEAEEDDSEDEAELVGAGA